MRCLKARKNISLTMDDRLAPAARAGLQVHLQACPSCREWQQEQFWLRDLVWTKQAIEPGPGFHAGLMAKVAAAPGRPRLFAFSSPFFRPIVLRAAAMLLIVMAALFGLFLGGRLDPAAPADGSAAVRQALNLDVFADLPGDSFGAVYESLLQGEIR